jgi:hypothetical protein
VSALEVDYSNPSFPLELEVVDTTTGSGITGLTCTVAIRMAGTPTLYLDWATNTFMNAGWAIKNQPMADLGTGVYQVSLPVQALGFTPLTGLPVELVAEYTQSRGTGVGGIDYITISELRPDSKLARQYNTNKMTALAPGQLTIFEDDGVTVQSVQTLTDAAGNPTVDAPGAPQRRGPAPP